MRFLGLTVLLTLAACTGSAPESTARAAHWDIDEDENLAVPVCAECGDVLDRDRSDCATCGLAFQIEPKTIACPECAGSNACIHCGDGHTCDVCDGVAKCTVCEATGALDGSACPDCAGKKHCAACATASRCERCADSGTCANCDGRGKITLR